MPARFRLQIGLFALLALAALSALAQTPQAVIEAGRSRLDLSPYVSYLADPDGRADAAAMYEESDRGRFQPLPGGNATFGFTQGAYWFNATLFNKDNSDERWIMVLQYPLLDYVDVYLRYPDGHVLHVASGDMLPFSARSVRYRHPNFWVQLPPRTEVDVLVRVQSKSSMQAPLALYTPGAFAEMERDAQFGIGIYDGILLALFFYNLVLWLSLKDSGYFWYMFHVAAFGMVMFCLNGLAFEYLWPNTPWLANHAIPIAMCFAQLAMHQFSRVFLQLHERWPLGDRLARLFIAFFGLLATLSLWLDYRVSVLIGTATVFPSVLFILYQTIRSVRQDFMPARLFLMAWFAFLMGTALYATVSFGVLPKVFLTEYGIQIGSALEMILLSFALAYRYANLRNENERLIHDANEQLERNVARRTAELSNALEQLADANARLRESNRRDALTSVFNRRHFRDVFEHLLHQGQEQSKPLGVLLLDLDNFKRVNDAFGHLAGDECLRMLARSLNELLVPYQAVLARFGGEEFVAALPDIGETKLLEVAEILRQRVAEETIRFGGHNIRITTSIGACVIAPNARLTPDEALHLADDALYAAKGAGRNCVRLGGGVAA